MLLLTSTIFAPGNSHADRVEISGHNPACCATSYYVACTFCLLYCTHCCHNCTSELKQPTRSSKPATSVPSKKMV